MNAKGIDAANEEKQAPAKASHDQPPPDALIKFMMQGWKEPSKKPAPKVPGAERFARRRQALSKAFSGEVLVIPTGHERIRANDTTYRFRPGSDFYYLTGNQEADCVLVLSPKGAGHEMILFAEPEVDHSTPAFFTDRARGALWVGPRLGLEGTRVRYGADRAIGLPELGKFLEGLSKGSAPVRVLRGLSAAVDGALPARAEEDKALSTAIAELRLVKEDSEVREIEAALKATKIAYDEALRAMKTSKTEREIEAAFDAAARRQGSGVGYGSIVACGPHATILHWTRNDGQLKKGQLVLIDAGVEGDNVYTADITRTFPVSGRYSKEQRALYDIVVAAQDAAIAAVKPGNDFLEPHRAAMRVLAQGLERLGILKEPAEEALREDRQTYKRYTLHNTSHMLGLDVHDNAAARPDQYRFGKLRAGMLLTIEPGLYFQLDDLTVPAKYRGIGIRIEEDVLVTAKGSRILSAGIPRRSKDVEAWMAQVWKKK